MTTSVQRYHSLSIVLHWSMALALLFMFASGLYMVNADISKAEQYQLFQIHKASGVVVLWALMLRVAVRVFTHAPVARNKTIETLANNVHWITATLLATLIVGHVSAVVWHQKKHNVNLIKRMWWNKK